MVPQGRNLWDQVLFVNSRVLISKMDVIRGVSGALCLVLMLKVATYRWRHGNEAVSQNPEYLHTDLLKSYQI